MFCLKTAILILCLSTIPAISQQSDPVIRINQLGYLPNLTKVAVFGTFSETKSAYFELISSETDKTILRKAIGRNFGSYGPFLESYRLDFSNISEPGTYYLQVGGVRSPEFRVSKDVYNGTADFALQYMRQQRCGFNPYLNDSCHTTDGYTVYGPMEDHSFVDVTGGWHDASDYLQYSSTSANATYHLLAAYRDFPEAFGDQHLSNGLDGENNLPDVLDEARWGLEWLLKMHPREDWMFNQIADDRDHSGYRLPTRDSVNYGYEPGIGRPVYFVSGKPQGLGKYQNRATGTSSIAGKFASALELGSELFREEMSFAKLLEKRSKSAYAFGQENPGVTQIAPNKAPYFYEEDNWTDDMELGAVGVFRVTKDSFYLDQALKYASVEKVIPWMGNNTARHYQWYPFHNFNHYELAKILEGKHKREVINYLKAGIEKVWQKAKTNAFYRGIPFIWCSNNLTTSFAIQCHQYRELTDDETFRELEQACFDWLFGFNPWGTSMVVGLPGKGHTPVSPHTSFTVLHDYPVKGGLVDGPVYGSIYGNLIGIKLIDPDEYALFQSDLAVYHDDPGDYSTNEPTMDGTASLIYLLAAMETKSK
ncbi:glycoside hydrolase family 9 protein [Membranihabitans maritimus]|uniref:glycoside hydrolase family 9 protein n=1 Tax=Membranihabitans maritimus TaxID=2904244 RepID=UPI001F486A52|nr:glycoside hydrolase family 9 protein [Membranihabitans maritimus]